MTNDIKQIVHFKADPHAVYEALMDSQKHSTFTNSPAQISREVGGDYSTYDGYITGKNLELVQDKSIRQTWRAIDWPENYFSVVEFIFDPDSDGTQLTFIHTGVLAGTEEEFTQGWIENYWEPLRLYLEG